MADGSAVPRSVPPADEGDETKPAAPLGGLDLWSYCNAIGYNGYVLTGANAYSYSCKDWSGGLHGLNNMDAPCNWQYHRGDVLSRFSTFYSTTSWQCYGSAGILGGIDFASYCKEHEGEGYTTQNNAYSVACTTESGGTFGINFDEACQSQYDQDAALSRVINFYDPNGWQCFITKP